MTQLFPRLTSPDGGVVLRVGDETMTDAVLARRCAGVRAALEGRGVMAGQRVGVWTQPSMETAVALAACAAGGFITVPIDPKLGPLELGHIAKDAQPVVTLAADAASVDGRLADVPVVALPLPEAEVTGAFRAVDDAPLLVLYTSGTTGLPKGAVLSARNAAFDVDGLAKAWAWTKQDTVVHALPLFHVHGLVLGLYGSLRNGAGLTWLPRFSPEAVTHSLSPIGGEQL